jgi:hypothetical protein
MAIGSERILAKGRRADKEQQLAKMQPRAENFIITIRSIIDPYAGEFTDFDLDRARAAMDDFCTLWKEAKKLKNEISEIEEFLNG